MFEIGWTEMLVIAVVMIVVVGPKDLPRMLRTFGKTMSKLRSMAGDFQKQFNEALKEAELDDVKKSVDSLRSLNPMAEIRKQLNPFEQAAADVRSGVDAALKPATPAGPTPVEPPAETVEKAAAPMANGAAPVPPGPTEMPQEPVFPAMSVEPPSPVATAAEPLKSGSVGLTGEGAASAPPAKAAPARKVAAKATAQAETSAKSAARAKPAVEAAAARTTAAKTAATKTAAANASPAKPKPARKSSEIKKNTAGTAT